MISKDTLRLKFGNAKKHFRIISDLDLPAQRAQRVDQYKDLKHLWQLSRDDWWHTPSLFLMMILGGLAAAVAQWSDFDRPYFWLLLVIMPIVYADFTWEVIPDELTLPGIAILVSLIIANPSSEAPVGLLITAAAVAIILPTVLFQLLHWGRVVGGGDVLLAACLGGVAAVTAGFHPSFALTPTLYTPNAWILTAATAGLLALLTLLFALLTHSVICLIVGGRLNASLPLAPAGFVAALLTPAIMLMLPS